MNRSTASVEQLDAYRYEGEVIGELPPLIPDGEYVAKFLHHETAWLFGTGKVYAWFEIVDPGPHHGTRLFKPYRVRGVNGRGRRNGGFKVGVRSNLYRDYARLSGHLTRPQRVSLHGLKGCLLKIRTRTVTHGYDQSELPATCRYSLIEELVSVEAGELG